MDLSPKQIVNQLDKYIIGQDDAKKAVAIALRNRYRRAQLPAEIREEITPKNIIMKGPTGVGKTEIARRLAKLVRGAVRQGGSDQVHGGGIRRQGRRGHDPGSRGVRLSAGEVGKGRGGPGEGDGRRGKAHGAGAWPKSKKEDRGETPKEIFEANLLDGLRKGTYDNRRRGNGGERRSAGDGARFPAGRRSASAAFSGICSRTSARSARFP